MEEHDPLCEWQPDEKNVDGSTTSYFCFCDIIAKLRRQLTVLHICDEEYAPNCVSCNLHEEIRKDERRKIASLIEQEGPWCRCNSTRHAVSLARQGSSAKTVYALSGDAIDDAEVAAYLWISKEDIKPPLRTIIDVECAIDVDADNQVIGVEIFGWPKKESDDNGD